MERDWQFRQAAETVMMLGKFQPWTARDTETFKRAITHTAQVVIAIRQVHVDKEQGPFYLHHEEIAEQIRPELEPLGFFEGKHYIIGTVPNVVKMFAGPDKDYVDEQTFLDTPPPDSAFKTAELKDPWANEETIIDVDSFNNKAQKHEDEIKGSITYSNKRHEDWDEG